MSLAQRAAATGDAACAGIAPPSPTAAHSLAWLRAVWPLLAVLCGFAIAAAVVPVLTQVSTTDDWAYSRSAQILVQEGRLTIFPVVAATAVFPVFWAGLFGLLFEPTLGVFRLSTVVITALGGVALAALCGELGVTRGRSALGVAAHLANPLTFVLAFTVMTDAHFVALLLVATWCFARAVRAMPVADDWVAAGSVFAGLAFLSRQQGALIVPAVVLFLLLTRRLRCDWSSLRLVLLLVAPVTLVMVGYYLWLNSTGVSPQVQSAFLREAMDEGWGGTWWLLRHLTFVEIIYFGFFTLPIMAAVAPAAGALCRGLTRPGWLAAALWGSVAVVGVAFAWQRGARMPYISQFFGSGGLGPPDVLGSRPKLLDASTRGWFTVVCLMATVLLALVLGRAVSQGLAAQGSPAPPAVSREDSIAGLVLCIGLGQVGGVLPPSYHYIGWTAGSLDRYLLPLAPLTIALALWGVRKVTIVPPLGWLVVAGMLAFAVAGTRDYLVYLRAVWQMADVAVARGVPLDRLDAGAGWDGYHLYEEGVARSVRSRTPRGGPWWVYFYGPATDSAYIVSSTPHTGYRAVARAEYSSWLQRKPTSLILLRRAGLPWPPAPDPASPYQRRAADGRPAPPAPLPARLPVAPVATP